MAKPTKRRKAYAAAVKVFPGYHPGYAGMGRAQAAKGEYKAAIASYERAQASTPMPDYAAALYDLYTIQKDPQGAQRQLDMIEVIDKINKNNGEVTNRNVALIFAITTGMSIAPWNWRRPSWTSARISTATTRCLALYKNKKFADADVATTNALKMGTPEPAFYYHAEQIARANGKTKEAEEYRSHYANRFVSIIASQAVNPDVGPELDRRAANNACFELRGSTDGQVVATMRKALEDVKVRACAGTNLRKAGAIEELKDALADKTSRSAPWPPANWWIREARLVAAPDRRGPRSSTAGRHQRRGSSVRLPRPDRPPVLVKSGQRRRLVAPPRSTRAGLPRPSGPGNGPRADRQQRRIGQAGRNAGDGCDGGGHGHSRAQENSGE